MTTREDHKRYLHYFKQRVWIKEKICFGCIANILVVGGAALLIFLSPIFAMFSLFAFSSKQITAVGRWRRLRVRSATDVSSADETRRVFEWTEEPERLQSVVVVLVIVVVVLIIVLCPSYHCYCCPYHCCCCPYHCCCCPYHCYCCAFHCYCCPYHCFFEWTEETLPARPS